MARIGIGGRRRRVAERPAVAICRTPGVPWTAAEWALLRASIVRNVAELRRAAVLARRARRRRGRAHPAARR